MTQKVIGKFKSPTKQKCEKKYVEDHKQDILDEWNRIFYDT